MNSHSVLWLLSIKTNYTAAWPHYFPDAKLDTCMFDSNILLIKFGTEFWFRVPDLGSGYRALVPGFIPSPEKEPGITNFWRNTRLHIRWNSRKFLKLRMILVGIENIVVNNIVELKRAPVRAAKFCWNFLNQRGNGHLCKLVIDKYY